MPPPLSRRIPRQCLLHRPCHRFFVTTPAQHAGVPRAQPQRIRPPVQKLAPSPTQMRRKQQVGQAGMRGLPTDMGLLPGTIIRPTGKNMPSIFTNPRKRLGFEYQWLIRRAIDKFGLYHWKFFLKGWGVKPRPQLERKAVVATAKDYHKQIYTAFAANDISTITRLCASGLASHFRARISHRAPNTHLTWTLASYTSTPRIVSNRASPFPDMDASGIRQVAVRIASKQILVTYTDEQALTAVRARIAALKAAGTEISPALAAIEKEDARKVVSVVHGGSKPISAHKIQRALEEDPVALEGAGEKVERKVVEYMVLQRRMLDGEEEGWMVWGFGEESTPEAMERDEKLTKDLTAYQKTQAAAQAGN